MNTTTCVAVICEFNPLHNGHEYLLQEIRRRHKDSTILCLMSGNYVQRGECAVGDKYLRAKTAVLCGADLVLELPIPFSISSAEGFANGAVDILTKLNGVDHLYFGSECGDIQTLTAVAEGLNAPDFQAKVAQRLRHDRRLRYPVAVDEQYSISYPNAPQLPKTPNDILGVHYIRAILRLNSPIQPHAVTRYKAGHDSQNPHDTYCSSSLLRNIVTEKGLDEARSFMNPGSVQVLKEAYNNGLFPIDNKFTQRVILNDLRNRVIQGEELGQYLYCQEIGKVLNKTVINAKNLDEVFQAVKDKSKTLSGIRRAILCAYLKIPKLLENIAPSYTTVLGFSNKGKEFLNTVRKKKNILLITKPADLFQLSKTDPIALANVRADSMYCGLYSRIQPWDRFLKATPYIGEKANKF